MQDFSGCDRNPHGHGCVAFLPIALSAPKPHPESYPSDPKTIGDHIRKKRMDLGLLQRDLAEIIGVDECTIHNWECTHSQPLPLLIQKIIEFLEYNPFEKESDSLYPIYLKTFGDHVCKKRLEAGITQKCLAQKLKVSVDAVRDWERGQTKPHMNNRVKIIEFLGSDSL